jgi:hypothetical protein
MSRARLLHDGLWILPLLLMLLLGGAVWAGSSHGPTVDWQVLSSSGAPAVGGAVTLNGTLGQTAIGLSYAGHGSLGAGFWYGAGKGQYLIYLPLMLRNS